MTPAEGCELITHGNGIHEFVFYESTRKTVDVFFDAIEVILRDTPLDENIYLMCDLQSGLPSLRYAMKRSKDLTANYFKSHTRGKAQHTMYIAFVMETNPLMQTFMLFVEQLARGGNTPIKLFDTRSSAMEWFMNSKGVRSSQDISK